MKNTFSNLTVNINSINKTAPKAKSKEKIGTTCQFGVVARSATGVRAHHKYNDENLLVYRRSGKMRS